MTTTRIDFSEPYYNATGRLLVKNSGAVQHLSDIKGHNVATTSGSVYDRWMKNCFPTASVITADTFTNAKLAFDQGRADAVMFDDAVLLPVAAADPNSKITDDVFSVLSVKASVRSRVSEGGTAPQNVKRAV